MKIAVVGGGPAGLYFSYLMKRRDRSHEVRIFERNARGATFGFGVVFSDRALEFLRDDDEDSYRHLMPHMESWPDLKIVHRDTEVPIDGNGFAAIGRLALLSLLEARCESVGAAVEHERTVRSLDELGEADLVVGADGANSLVRGALGERPADLSEALALYEERRRPPVEKLVSAANASARWYARMDELMSLEPYDFAYHYMTRTGRVSDDRLRTVAPRFMARYRARNSS